MFNLFLSRSPRRRPRKNVRKTNNSWQPTPIVRFIEPLVDRRAALKIFLRATPVTFINILNTATVDTSECILVLFNLLFHHPLQSPRIFTVLSRLIMMIMRYLPCFQVVQSYSHAMILKPGRDLIFSLVPRYAGTAVTTYGGAVGPATI